MNQDSMTSGKAVAQPNSLSQQSGKMSDNIEALVHLNEILESAFSQLGGVRPVMGEGRSKPENPIKEPDGLIEIISNKNETISDQLNKAHFLSTSIAELL